MIPGQGSDGPALDGLYACVERYYTTKVRRFGPTPLGVDWSCIPTQELRFVQLLKLCDFTGPFSLNDLGCGYGALWTYLGWRHPGADVDYLGVDLSAAMISRARRLRKDASAARFHRGRTCPRVADYAVASGIFNVQLDQPLAAWERFVEETLLHLSATTRRGFAINFMLERATGNRAARPGLYRTLPSRWIALCEQAFEADVDVVTDYGLREFTLLVRRRSSGYAVDDRPRRGEQERL